MITWLSHDNKRLGASRGSQFIPHKLPCPILFLFKKKKKEKKEAYVIEPCLTHRIPYLTGPSCSSPHVGPVQQTNLCIQVHGPNMTTSKILWHVNSVFFALSDNSCSVDLISQSTQYYRKQFLTAVLCAGATILSTRCSTVGDHFPSISMLKYTPVTRNTLCLIFWLYVATIQHLNCSRQEPQKRFAPVTL